MTSSRTATFATLSAATSLATGLAAIVSALVFTTAPSPDQAVAAAPTVQQLPRVVVTGQVQRSAQVIELPRVVVTGRRSDDRAPQQVVLQAQRATEPGT